MQTFSQGPPVLTSIHEYLETVTITRPNIYSILGCAELGNQHSDRCQPKRLLPPPALLAAGV